MRPSTFITSGLTLILGGFSLPMLMALGVVATGFALAFAAHLLSSIGFVLALYGVFRSAGAKPRVDLDA